MTLSKSKAFEKKVKELQWMGKLVEKSKLTEKDAERIGHKIKHAMFKRFEKKSKSGKQRI